MVGEIAIRQETVECVKRATANQLAIQIWQLLLADNFPFRVARRIEKITETRPIKISYKFIAMAYSLELAASAELAQEFGESLLDLV
jgi:hypothetical protein